MSNQILIPYDFSDDVKKMLKHVDVWGKENGYHFLILHVTNSFAAKDAENLINQDLQELQLQTPCQVFVTVGTPYERIVEYTAETNPKEIFITTHTHSFAERLLLGNHTDYILHHVKCPVYVYRAPAENEIRENRILVPIGVTDVSIQVLEQAVERALQDQAEIHLAYVLCPEGHLHLTPDDPAPKIQAHKERLQEVQKKYIPEQIPVVINVFCAPDPGAALTAYQKEINAKLIMMAAHKYTKIGRLFLGSTTDYLVQHTNTPMFVLKFPGEYGD